VTASKRIEGSEQQASLETNVQTNPKPQASIDDQFFGTSFFDSKINSIKPQSQSYSRRRMHSPSSRYKKIPTQN